MTRHWCLSWRADPAVRPLADRHYTRQRIGAPQFAPPGRCLVLRTLDARAYWITSWPFARYVKHEWPGAWICSAFRNETDGELLSSELIREALAITVWRYGAAPAFGMVTMVDPSAVRPKRDPGRCFVRAGFVRVGETKEEGHLVFQLEAERDAGAVVSAVGPPAGTDSLEGSVSARGSQEMHRLARRARDERAAHVPPGREPFREVLRRNARNRRKAQRRRERRGR